jgi:hypothetical protein
MKTGLLQNDSALDFILAGNSTVTFLNTQSQNRFTFKVTKPKDKDVHFVSVLTGPDTYTFLGSIFNGNFKSSKKSTISESSQSFQVFNFVFNRLKTKNLPNIIEIYHEGKCGRCGRQLTVPESIVSGFGPECVKKIKIL